MGIHRPGHKLSHFNLGAILHTYLGPRKSPHNCKSQGYGRIQMSSRYMTNGVNYDHHCKSPYSGNTKMSNGTVGFLIYNNRSTSYKYQEICPNNFCYHLRKIFPCQTILNDYWVQINRPENAVSLFRSFCFKKQYFWEYKHQALELQSYLLSKLNRW